MPGTEDDVAVLVRMKAHRDAAMMAREAWNRRQAQAPGHDHLQSAARSRWPTSMALLRSLALHYQHRADDLGMIVKVEDIVRLRAWLPEVSIHVMRNDRALGTHLLFRMARDGRTFCRIQQTKGIRQTNLNREDFPIRISERNIRFLLRTVVQILIVH